MESARLTDCRGVFGVIEDHPAMVNKDPEDEEEDNGAHQFVDWDSPEKSEADKEARLDRRCC